MNETTVAKLLEDTGCTCRSNRLTRTAVALAVHTGCRAGELVQLRWDDVDFIRGEIRVASPKGRPTPVPLTPALSKALAHWHAHMLRAARRRRQRRMPSFVLGGLDGRPMPVVLLLAILREHARTLGLPASPHALRRAAVSALRAGAGSGHSRFGKRRAS